MKNIAREDRRVAKRRADCDAARRKLMPIMVTVCEAHGVSSDDILSSSHHPHVVMARNVVTFLGWDYCKISVGVLADILKKERVATSKKLARLRSEASLGFRSEFGRQVAVVMKRIAPSRVLEAVP